MVVIKPCVNVVDFPSPGLAGSTFRHLGWRKVTCVAFFTFRQAKLTIKFKEDYFLQSCWIEGHIWKKKLLSSSLIAAAASFRSMWLYLKFLPSHWELGRSIQIYSFW
jgi:hypothetical protein